MLHAAMIYGGSQENNVQRLLGAIRRFRTLPVPGGGRQIVQPIYIDDVVECLFRANNKMVGQARGRVGWDASFVARDGKTLREIYRPDALSSLFRLFYHWPRSPFFIEFVPRRLTPGSCSASARM